MIEESNGGDLPKQGFTLTQMSQKNINQNSSSVESRLF